MKKSYIIAAVLLIPIVIALWAYSSYITSTRPVEITFSNVHDVTLTETDANNQSEIRVSNSPVSLRLQKDSSYTATYKGNDGYASGSVSIAKEADNVTIDPDYDTNKNNELLTQAIPAINTVLTAKYSNVNDIYVIEPVAARNKGEWAAIRLKYKGEYSENSDSLRVLLHKDNGAWSIVCTPDVIVTKTKCPSVDRAVLSWLNSSF